MKTIFNSSSLLVLSLLLSTTLMVAVVTGHRRSTQENVSRRLDEQKGDGKYMDAANEKVMSTEFFTEWKVYSQHGSKEKDKISSLPGQPPDVGFAQYSGHVTIDKARKRNIFYYFVEADGPEPSTAPLLLWLNGGPGCSSLIGAMEEVGPFRIMSDGRTLFKNPFAWNKVANVLFMEYPAGVGFSYSGDTEEYVHTGDTKTAEDGYGFLVNWFERFPEYKGREFYITGESYGGHYVPQLATLVHRFNQIPGSHYINVKGIGIGNGVLNDKAQGKGYYDYLWSHALISDDVIHDIHEKCSFDIFGFVLLYSKEPKCARAIMRTGSALDGIDMFNIYAPLCANDTITNVPKAMSIDKFDPCSSTYLTSYMNQPDVQQAMHAKVDFLWSECSSTGMGKNWVDSPKDVLPLLKELTSSGVRVLVYSGDVDARVPVTSTRYALALLKFPVTTPWSLWKANQEVAGFSVVYEGNLTFATVRGAGHKVPSDQPLRALELIKNFVGGTPLPSK